MRKLSFVSIAFLLCISTIARCEEPFANEDLPGLYARSIEQVLRLKPEEIDLATAALIVSEQWSEIVHGRRYLQQLDDMAAEIRRRIRTKKNIATYEAVIVINEYLFDELGFKSVKEADNPDDLFLHSVLDEKQGYCLSLSVLYLGLGERLGLDLYGVVVPGHFFVRYDDGRVRFNIETTSNGGTASDEHYIEKFNVVDETDGIYLRNLNKLETLGCFFNNLGNSYTEVGDINQALSALEIAVEINPSLSESRSNLGNIYLRKGMANEAIYQYRLALQSNPRDAKTHNNLGNAYSREKMVSAAIIEYLTAIELDPDFIDGYANLAAAYANQQMYGKAIGQLNYATTLEPEKATLYVQMGEIYRRMENYDEAIFQYKKALRRKRDLAQAHNGIGICYGEMNETNKAIAAYKKALKIDPKMAAAMANLGNVYFGRKKYDKALEYYNNAVRIQPDDGSTHYNIAAAYSNKKEYEKAVPAYLKAVELDTLTGLAHNGLAFAYYQLKNYPSAAKHLELAEQLDQEIDPNLLAAIEAKVNR